MKIKSLLLTILLLAAMAGNVDAQTKSTPIVQGFESVDYPCFDYGAYPTPACMDGWMYYCADDVPDPDPDEAVYYGYVSSVAVDDLPGHESTYCFCLDNDENYGFLVSPNLTGCGFSGAVSLSFYHRVYAESVTFEVLYSMDDIQVGDEIDYDSFTWKANIAANEDWNVYLDNFPIGVKHIVIASRGGESIYPYVDDITIEEATGGCVTPSGLKATPTKTSLGLSWAGGSPSYELRYKAGSCNTFESGFEGWTTIDADGVGDNGDGHNWALGNHPNVGGHNGSANYVYSESNDNAGVDPEPLSPNNYLVSPRVQLGGCITFWAKARENVEHFGVAVSTTGNTSDEYFTTIAEFDAGDEWTKYSVDINPTLYNGMGYIAIRHFLCDDGCEPDWQLCVDDVTIFTPSAWTSVNGITNTTCTLNGLKFETMYDIQVRGDCGADGYSDWAEVYAMTSNADYRFINAGDWDDEGNWREGEVPGASSDVVIAAAATIPANCLAQSNNINLSMGSITIQDGGQLKHNNAGVVATMEKSIIGYSGDHDNYKLVAMPMTVSEHNLISDSDYDLYMFDQTGIDVVEEQPLNREWRNYKAGQFDFVSGLGYLYANADNMTISITGELESISEEGYPVSLVFDYDETTQFPGWNLIGNPYACNAYLADGRGFYRLEEVNGESKIVPATDNVIAPMEGIFVQTTNTEGETITFTTVAPEQSGMGSMEFTLRKAFMRNEVNLDRSLIRFGEGHNMGHLDLMADPNRLYIPLDGKAMSVVYSQPVGELPLNFEAADDGTFFLGFANNAEDLAYCHLIDNLTGADIDLLQQPEYTFQGKQTDYASRFRVVFVANDAEGIADDSETFAFNSYGSWIIVNEGLATLQVIDIQGRVISNETIEGCVSKTIQAAPGVYVLRLVNGENVRVQKVIVR